MRSRMFLSFIFIFFTVSSFAQNLTGIWRGYFISGVGIYQERYNYEIQMRQTKSKIKGGTQSSIMGVTYSYHTKDFYGKAGLHGISNSSTQSLTVVEDTLVEVQNSAGFTCLMTSYLQYRKDDKTEILEGTFSSIGAKKADNCGDGYVYLEKVKTSDFPQEHFLEKNPSKLQNNDVANNNKKLPADLSITNAKLLQHALGVNEDGVIGNKTKSLLKLKLPSFKDSLDVNNTDQIKNIIEQLSNKNVESTNQNLTKRKMPSGKNFDTTSTNTAATQTPLTNISNPVNKAVSSLPLLLTQRENPLVKTIQTHSPNIKVELYDNGIIDGDTITVYHNNQLIVDSKELTKKPITINITADSTHTHHEFIMVANNLGRIPPNTALMIITTGDDRYEVNISSDEETNAKLVVDYVK